MLQADKLSGKELREANLSWKDVFVDIPIKVRAGCRGVTVVEPTYFGDTLEGKKGACGENVTASWLMHVLGWRGLEAVGACRWKCWVRQLLGREWVCK